MYLTNSPAVIVLQYNAGIELYWVVVDQLLKGRSVFGSHLHQFDCTLDFMNCPAGSSLNYNGMWTIMFSVAEGEQIKISAVGAGSIEMQVSLVSTASVCFSRIDCPAAHWRCDVAEGIQSRCKQSHTECVHWHTHSSLLEVNDQGHTAEPCTLETTVAMLWIKTLVKQRQWHWTFIQRCLIESILDICSICP